MSSQSDNPPLFAAEAQPALLGSASHPHVALRGNRVEEHPDPAAAMASVETECAIRRKTQVGAPRAIQDLAVEISAMVVPVTSRL